MKKIIINILSIILILFLLINICPTKTQAVNLDGFLLINICPTKTQAVNLDGIMGGADNFIEKGKTGTNMAIDIASSVVPGKAADKIMSGLNKAITSDLNSNTAAIMPKEVRSELLQAQNSINSSSGEIIKESTANFIGGLVGGQTNEFFKPTTTEGYQLPPQNNNIIQQNDVTRIQQDYYEVKIKNPW